MVFAYRELEDSSDRYGKRICERAGGTLDLIAYVSRPDRDISAGPQLRWPRRGKITGKNGEKAAAETGRRRSGEARCG